MHHHHTLFIQRQVDIKQISFDILLKKTDWQNLLKTKIQN